MCWAGSGNVMSRTGLVEKIPCYRSAGRRMCLKPMYSFPFYFWLLCDHLFINFIFVDVGLCFSLAQVSVCLLLLRFYDKSNILKQILPNFLHVFLTHLAFFPSCCLVLIRYPVRAPAVAISNSTMGSNSFFHLYNAAQGSVCVYDTTKQCFEWARMCFMCGLFMIKLCFWCTSWDKTRL